MSNTATLTQQVSELFAEGRHESAYALFLSDPDSLDGITFESFYSGQIKMRAMAEINKRTTGTAHSLSGPQ